MPYGVSYTIVRPLVAPMLVRIVLTRDSVGVSRIPISDAAQLVNRTVPIANDPGYYVVSLDVFHELHCLVGRSSGPARSRPEMRGANVIVHRMHYGDGPGGTVKRIRISH